MNKTKTLTILVGILALINIALLIFLLIGRPKGPGPDGFGGKEKAEIFLQKKFGFDDQQMELFRISKENHSSNSKDLQMQLGEISQAYYLGGHNMNVQEKDSFLTEINRISEQIYRINFKHFDEVREICKPDQLDGMESFINNLMARKRDMKGGQKGKRH